jgi:xylulose-5-phosphate/fructose-6-phosphate phosphoketolase
VFDNPELVVACVIGDGEAETGPLATSWHSNKFLNLITDGAVLPILHLNGYKIANPAVLARIEPEELDQLLRGYGWTPYFVEGDKPEIMHQLMATALEKSIERIRQIQSNAREHNDTTRPRWPMIVLKSPKVGPDRKWSMGCRSRGPSGAPGTAPGGFQASRPPTAARNLAEKL